MKLLKEIKTTKVLNNQSRYSFSQVVEVDKETPIHRYIQAIISTMGDNEYIESINIKTVDLFDFESQEIDYETRRQFEIKDIEDNNKIMEGNKMATTSDDLKEMVRSKLIDNLMMLDTPWNVEQICEEASISEAQHISFMKNHMDLLIGKMIEQVKKH